MTVTHEDLRAGRLNIYKLTGDEAVDLVAEHDAVLADRDRLLELTDMLDHTIKDLGSDRAGLVAERDRLRAELKKQSELCLRRYNAWQETQVERDRLRDKLRSLTESRIIETNEYETLLQERDRMRDIIREQVPYPASPDSNHSETPNGSTYKEDLQVPPMSLSDADISNQLRLLGSGCVGTISGHHCQLMNEAADAIERLQALLTPCLPDTDAQTDPSYPATVNDVLHLLSCYIADFLPHDAIPGDEYFAAWERQARPVIERIMTDNDRLRGLLQRWISCYHRDGSELLSTGTILLHAETEDAIGDNDGNVS